MLSFNFKPLTFNNVYASNRSGRRFLTKEGKEYKENIESVSANHFADLRSYDQPLKFTMIVRGPWLTNKGEISKTAGDIDGFVKLCLDSICTSIGVNDCVVTELYCRKEYAANWSFDVNLERAFSINPVSKPIAP